MTSHSRFIDTAKHSFKKSVSEFIYESSRKRSFKREKNFVLFYLDIICISQKITCFSFSFWTLGYSRDDFTSRLHVKTNAPWMHAIARFSSHFC